MTYYQAKVFECIRTGIGASIVEVMRVCEVKDQGLFSAISGMMDKGWVDWRNVEGQRLFFPTQEGVSAYEQWRDIPF